MKYNSLYAPTGDTHRRQRKMLTPVFSAKHLRSAVSVFYQVVDKVRRVASSDTCSVAQAHDLPLS